MKIFQAKSVNDETPVRSPEPLKIGDLVKLKSGGPMMTVSGLNSNGMINEFGYVGCMWFEVKELTTILRSDVFPPACLDVYEPDNKGD